MRSVFITSFIFIVNLLLFIKVVEIVTIGFHHKAIFCYLYCLPYNILNCTFVTFAHTHTHTYIHTLYCQKCILMKGLTTLVISMSTNLNVSNAGLVFVDEFLAHLKSHQRCSAAFCRPVKFFHTDWIIISLWSLSYTQRHCHIRIEKSYVQTVAITLDSLEYHYMLQH